MMTAAGERAASIRLLRWTIETKIPADLRATTHARRIASLRRQLAEARAELARLELEELVETGQACGDHDRPLPCVECQ